MRLVSKLLLPFVLFSALTLNGALTVTGWQSPSYVDENREMAKFPVWGSGLTPYVLGLNAWLKDNFAFRKALVYAFNDTLYSYFRSTLVHGVVIGKGPWVFGAEFDGQRSVAPHRLDPAYVEKVKQALLERKKWLDQRGIHMLVMFMPTKAAIYGNRYLPAAWHFKQTERTESEQIYDALEGIMPENIVPVRGAMMRASKTAELYYHTDPHPTQNGTFIAYEQIAAHIQKYFPDAAPSPFPPYSLKIDYYEPTAYGRLLGLPFVDESWVPVPDGEYHFTAPVPPSWSSLLPAGSRLTYYENTHAKKITAAVIGDSFTNRMAAIVGETFSQAATVNINNVSDDPSARFPMAFLDAYRPNFAIFMYVESRLVECGPGCAQFPIDNPKDLKGAE